MRIFGVDSAMAMASLLLPVPAAVASGGFDRFSTKSLLA